MDSKKLGKQSELISSLASTIHKNMLEPSTEKIDTLNMEIQQINQRLFTLTTELIKHRKSDRLILFFVFFLAGCATLLSIILFYFKM